MRKIDFYGPIQGEPGVIMAFTKVHELLGFKKLIPSSSRGFDIDSIEYNGHDVTIEFEYLSSNFIAHKHQNNMSLDRKYVVVCLEDDCGLATKLKNDYSKELFDIIEMRKYVKIQKNLTRVEAEEPLYVVLSYNPDKADKVDFGEWNFVNCFRTPTSTERPKFASDKLPAGSKILFYQNGYIVGGCTVVRYEIIKTPKTANEWSLYKMLMDYPTTLYNMDIEEYQEYFRRCNGQIGHIFYSDFFDCRDFKIKLSNFIEKKMSRHGKINITRDEYNSIIGH